MNCIAPECRPSISKHNNKRIIVCCNVLIMCYITIMSKSIRVYIYHDSRILCQYVHNYSFYIFQNERMPHLSTKARKQISTKSTKHVINQKYVQAIFV